MTNKRVVVGYDSWNKKEEGREYTHRDISQAILDKIFVGKKVECENKDHVVYKFKVTFEWEKVK